MNGNICYFYHNGTYRTTIAYQRNDDGTVSYGASFCRPTDQFTKQLGRKIALGRMRFQLPLIHNAPEARWALHEEILRRLEAREHRYVPSCFRS